VARAELVQFSGEGYQFSVEGFSRVNGYATGDGMDDRAFLYDSLADETLVARPACAVLHGADYRNNSQDFDRLNAFETAGGSDRADIRTADTFIGRDDYFCMLGAGYDNRGTGFDSVFAYGLAGGSNRLSVADVLFSFTSIGPWI
jgi:hypothetical protein